MERIAVIAEPFGFGPAAKAWAIAKELTETFDCAVDFYGSGAARAFFASQNAHVFDLDEAPGACRQRLRSDAYSGYLLAIAPEWTDLLHDRLDRTYYVDSLGFMWERADFPADSRLYDVRRYFVQDLFDSMANLTDLGFANITAVPGIVDRAARTQAPSGARGGLLVHLGGLTNPIGNGGQGPYVEAANQLIRALPKAWTRGDGVTVAMNTALSRHWDQAVGGAPRQLTHPQMQAALAAHKVVLSSPGLTTLIEASLAGTPYVPLPPQNWSQVRIVQKMAARDSASSVWKYLDYCYADLPASGSEAEKVLLVQERNAQLWTSRAARQGYLDACTAVDPERDCVLGLGAPFTGAADVAAYIGWDRRLTPRSVPAGSRTIQDGDERA